MKRAGFKLLPAKGGWIQTTIAPINDRRAGRFGLSDIFMLGALVLGLITVARLFIAH